MKKKCNKCGVEKPNTLEFFRKSTKLKLRNGCRECEKEYNKKYNKENRESVSEARKKWLEKNKDRISEQNSARCKKYREKNKEKLKEYKAKWHQENRERILKRNKEKWREKHPIEEIAEGYKKCPSCNEIKPKTNEYFSLNKSAKDGYAWRCKECRRSAEYWANPEEVKAKRKTYYEENKEKVFVHSKKYRIRNLEWYQNYNKEYYQKNKVRMKENSKKSLYRRTEQDIGFRILQRCRKRLWDALKGNVKSQRTIELIGCSVDELLIHLESQFREGMNWDNYGEWHVDHIKPCAMFDFSKEEHQKECFHYTNLQPLWAIENIRKSNKYEEHSK